MEEYIARLILMQEERGEPKQQQEKEENIVHILEMMDILLKEAMEVILGIHT